MNHELRCPVCGKTEFSRELTVIDRRTGKKAVGLGTLIFGIVLVVIALFLIVLIVSLWNDRTVPGRQYIYLPIVLLIGGVPIIISYLSADRVKKIITMCASCGKTITQDEIEGANLAGLEVQAKRERVRTAGSTKKSSGLALFSQPVLWLCFYFAHAWQRRDSRLMQKLG